MLGSLQEAQDVLANRGVALDTKTVRLIAYRYAAGRGESNRSTRQCLRTLWRGGVS